MPNMNLRDTIASITGLRAVTDADDSVIHASTNAKGFIHIGGIQSPGLTASARIARHVVSFFGRKCFGGWSRKALNRCESR